jgi:DNA-binding NarL/FixJ family response regulator
MLYQPDPQQAMGASVLHGRGHASGLWRSFADRPLRVLVADAQPLIRRGLVGVLSDTFPQWSFREAGGLSQVVEQLDTNAARTDVDLVVADLDLPGINGGAGVGSLRNAHSAPRIVVLAGTEDWNTMVGCLAAGVHGYLLKRDASEQLTHAIRTVMSGGVYLPPVLPARAPYVSASSAMPVASAPVTLTTRQQQVLTLLAEGQSTKDIARSLNLGIGTVKIHLAGAYRTLAVRNRAEAIRSFRGGDIADSGPATP